MVYFAVKVVVATPSLFLAVAEMVHASLIVTLAVLALTVVGSEAVPPVGVTV